MKNPKYTYAPRGNLWAVLEWKYLPFGKTGQTVCYFSNKEYAKAMAKQLNETEAVHPEAIPQ